MHSRTVWVFVILCCGCMNIAKSNILYRNSFSDVQIKPENERLSKIMPALKSGTRTNLKMVKRRAALIVDEDFDIAPNLNHQENVSDILVEVDDENGSGTEAFNEKETSQVTFHVTELSSESLKTNGTTSSTQSLTKAEEPEVRVTVDQVSTLTDSDSSGDGMGIFSKEHVTTEETTDSHTIDSHNQQEIIPHICMNTTCDSIDLSVSSSDERRAIAEGSNLTLSCNSSNSNMLYWYKSNGSVHFLQAFSREGQLDLNLQDVKPVQSGKYICVHWVNKQVCCNMQSDLQVYEVPLYKYHLIILGLIVAACLIICIILSVRQSKAFRSYTQEFVEKHGSVRKQLL